MTRQDVITEARCWIGTRYRKKGRNRQGVDCLGLLCVVADAFGIRYRDRDDYTNWPAGDRSILGELRRYLEPATGALPGTVGVFAETRLPGHVGIFSARGERIYLVHAHIARGVVEEEYEWNPAKAAFRLVDRLAFPGLV